MINSFPDARVLMVNPYYLPIVGGAEIYAHRLSRRLLQHDVPVDVVTAGFRGLPREEDLDGVHIYRLPGVFDQTRYEDLSPLRKLRAQAAFIAGVSRFLLARGRTYSILHRHTLAYPFEVFVARRLGIKTVGIVATAGDLTFVRSQVARRFSPWRPLITTVNTWAVRRFDAVIGTSQEIRTELDGLGIDQATVHHIPYGVDTDQFAPVSQSMKADLRQRMGLPSGSLVVFTGRLVHRKGVDVLLDAWSTVSCNHADATLLIAGAGPSEKALRGQAQALGLQSRVRFLGELSDVVPLLQAADVYAFASRGEGLPNSVLEAMAAGLPIVATRIGGIVDAVQSDHSGLLVPTDDSEALARALDRLLAHPQMCRRLGSEARQTVIRNYSLRLVTERYLALYRQLIES